MSPAVHPAPQDPSDPVGERVLHPWPWRGRRSGEGSCGRHPVVQRVAVLWVILVSFSLSIPWVLLGARPCPACAGQRVPVPLLLPVLVESRQLIMKTAALLAVGRGHRQGEWADGGPGVVTWGCEAEAPLGAQPRSLHAVSQAGSAAQGLVATSRYDAELGVGVSARAYMRQSCRPERRPVPAECLCFCVRKFTRRLPRDALIVPLVAF